MSADPFAESIAAYDDHSDEYANWSATLSMAEQITRFTAPLRPGARVLDAGCGPGRDLKILREMGFDALGIDASWRFVEIAQEAGLDARLGDLRALPIPRGNMDAIWSCASLVHLDADQALAALSEFVRVLRPGGRLFITVKHGADSEGWAETQHGRRWFRWWSGEAFEILLLGAGFIIGIHVDNRH